MAEAIGQLFESPEMARKFGQAARQRFQEKFSLEVTVGPLTQLLLQSEQLPGFAEAADSLAVPPPFRPKTALLSAEPGARAIGAESHCQSVGPGLPQRQLSH
jgi:hypothetical protein